MRECPNCGHDLDDCVGNCIFDDFPVPVQAEPQDATPCSSRQRDSETSAVSGEAREEHQNIRDVSAGGQHSSDSRGGENNSAEAGGRLAEAHSEPSAHLWEWATDCYLADIAGWKKLYEQTK